MRVLTISKITRQDLSSKQLHDCSLMQLHYYVKYFFKKHSDDFQDQTKQKVKQTTKTKAKVQRKKRMQKKYFPISTQERSQEGESVVYFAREQNICSQTPSQTAKHSWTTLRVNRPSFLGSHLQGTWCRSSRPLIRKTCIK